MSNIAVGVIDYQRGFIPAEEGVRLDLPGFGELGVTAGETVLPTLNRLLQAGEHAGAVLFTTQDWHPAKTAHFSDDPDYETTWPVHCVMGTPGAELHPGLDLPDNTESFYKGWKPLDTGEEDTSYSGFNAARGIYEAKNLNGGPLLTMERFLSNHSVKTVVLGGLALDYCVGASAKDFKTKSGLDVVVVADATKPVSEERGVTMLQTFAELGINVVSEEAALELIGA